MRYRDHVDWHAVARKLDAEKRTLKNVADIVWRSAQRDREIEQKRGRRILDSSDCLELLRDIRTHLDDIIMMVLEIGVYLSGHEKAMTPTQFGRQVGLTGSTIHRYIRQRKIFTLTGLVNPCTLRQFGVGPFSPWPRQECQRTPRHRRGRVRRSDLNPTESSPMSGLAPGQATF